MEPRRKLSTIEKLSYKYPFYVQIGFGLVVLFGMVGSLAGKAMGSTLVFVVTTVVWTSCRIVQEAIVATRVLKALKAVEDAIEKGPEPKDESRDDT